MGTQMNFLSPPGHDSQNTPKVPKRGPIVKQKSSRSVNNTTKKVSNAGLGM